MPSRFSCVAIFVHWPLILSRGANQSCELGVASLGAIYGDAALEGLGPAMLAEAADALAGPASAHHVLERSLPFAAPRDSGHFVWILP